MNLNHIIFHFLFILHSIFILNFCYYFFPLSFPYIPSPLVPSTPLVLFIAFFLCISPALKPLLSFYPVLFHLTFLSPSLFLHLRLFSFLHSIYILIILMFMHIPVFISSHHLFIPINILITYV